MPAGNELAGTMRPIILLSGGRTQQHCDCHHAFTLTAATPWVSSTSVFTPSPYPLVNNADEPPEERTPSR